VSAVTEGAVVVDVAPHFLGGAVRDEGGDAIMCYLGVPVGLGVGGDEGREGRWSVGRGIVGQR
jgi:hypothetical protein